SQTTPPARAIITTSTQGHAEVRRECTTMGSSGGATMSAEGLGCVEMTADATLGTLGALGVGVRGMLGTLPEPAWFGTLGTRVIADTLDTLDVEPSRPSTRVADVASGR